MAETKIVITAETGRAEQAMQSLANAAGTLGATLGRLPAIGAAFAPAALVAGLGHMAKSAIDAADGLGDLSQRFGIGIRELTSYQLIAEQSGSSLEGVAAGLRNLSRTMVDNGAALRAAGIDTSNTTEAMRGLADLFASLPDGPQKTALAIKLFGKAGADLIPVLNGGAAALDKSAEATERLGRLYEELAPQADELNDTFAELGTYAKAFAAALANAVSPALLDIIRNFANAARAGQDFSTAMARGLGLESLDTALKRNTEEIERVDGLLLKLTRTANGTNLYSGRIAQLKQYRDELMQTAGLLESEADLRRKQRASAGVDPLTEDQKATNRSKARGLLASLGTGGDSSANAAKQARDEADAWVKSIDAQIDAERTLAEATADVAAKRADEIQKFKDIADPAAKYRAELARIAELGTALDSNGNPYLSADEVDKATAAINRQIDALSKTDDIGRELGLTFSSAFEDAIARGENLSDVLKGIEQDIIRIIARESITEPLLKGISGLDLGGMLGGLFGGGGAYTGADTGAVDLGGSISDYLGSFATGLDYVPKDGFAKIHEGERIMTKQENLAYRSGMAGGSAAPSVQVNVLNQGTPQRYQQQDMSWDGETMVLTLVASDIERDGPVSQAITRNFGVGRGAGAR